MIYEQKKSCVLRIKASRAAPGALISRQRQAWKTEEN